MMEKEVQLTEVFYDTDYTTDDGTTFVLASGSTVYEVKSKDLLRLDDSEILDFLGTREYTFAYLDEVKVKNGELELLFSDVNVVTPKLDVQSEVNVGHRTIPVEFVYDGKGNLEIYTLEDGASLDVEEVLQFIVASLVEFVNVVKMAPKH